MRIASPVLALCALLMVPRAAVAQYDSGAGAVGLLVVLVIAVGLFILLRALVLWYWRVDRVVELLESIDGRLAVIQRAGGPAAVATGPQPAPERNFVQGSYPIPKPEA